MDMDFDGTEYGDSKVTEEQYKYIADRLCEILKDDDIKKYRMLLVELGEKRVSKILGHTLIYGGEGAKDIFWSAVSDEREDKALDRQYRKNS